MSDSTDDLLELTATLAASRKPYLTEPPLRQVTVSDNLAGSYKLAQPLGKEPEYVLFVIESETRQSLCSPKNHCDFRPSKIDRGE